MNGAANSPAAPVEDNMKIYGVVRFAFFPYAPDEAICKKCYDQRFATVGKLSPLSRKILGYQLVTHRDRAHSLHCENCKKRLA